MSDIPAGLWASVEAAGPNDPQPLLEAADWLDENGEGEWAPGLAYALRWCAGHNKRPLHRREIRLYPWRWIREGARTPRHITLAALRAQGHAVLSQWLFRVQYHEPWCGDWKTSLHAYLWLAQALGMLRAVVEVRSIVLPPAPEIVRTGPVTCAACGIMRDRGVLDCPVCRSSEVKS